MCLIIIARPRSVSYHIVAVSHGLKFNPRMLSHPPRSYLFLSATSGLVQTNRRRYAIHLTSPWAYQPSRRVLIYISNAEPLDPTELGVP